MQTSHQFFLKHAGYSWSPTMETRAQGRRNCARKLAAAEKSAVRFSFDWSIDPYFDSSEWSDDPDPWQTWQCVMRDESGAVVNSLTGIDFGRDGEPWADPYRRVVEAELILGL